MKNEYYALITVELSSKDEDRRNCFNKLLEQWYYVKIRDISTTWQVKIKANSQAAAYRAIEHNLLSAKERCELSVLNYSCQLSKEKVITKSL